MGIGKKIYVYKEYLRLEAKCHVISTCNNNTVCPCHTIEEVPSEATEMTRTNVSLRCASVFLLMLELTRACDVCMASFRSTQVCFRDVARASAGRWA